MPPRQRRVSFMVECSLKKGQNEVERKAKVNHSVTDLFRKFWNTAVNLKSCIYHPIPSTTPSEILLQTRTILQDYIYRKLQMKQCTTFRVKFKLSGDELSNTVVNVGETLERLYPKVYNNVSRKLSMTMSTPDVVKTALFTILNAIFSGDINWGKLLCMLAITSSFAIECIQQGHAEFLSDIIENVITYVSLHLSDWLLLQGGWHGFKRVHRSKTTMSPELVYIGGIIVLFFCITLLTFSLLIILK
ncbi:hypothetical protein SNE40_000980 [Patella caerulea]|uniref:Bcl-2 Bcl-2 homology region 1-3 domain-containing protein n=1 Tax=Patella caerulea TaxID=87958 RepID=A0AAN8KID7_PATCE